MIQTQAEFNNVMANILAAKYLKLLGGKLEMSQTEINEMGRFGFMIQLKDPSKPTTSPLVMTLITVEEAQRLINESRRQN